MSSSEAASSVPESDTSGLTFHSTLSGPIESLSLLRQSLLFAELSNLCYFSEPVVAEAARRLGFSHCEFFDRDGAQAYLLFNEVDKVIACRGTEPNEWNDIKADANAVSALAETAGRVHRGFKSEVDDLWPRLESALVDNRHTLWFTGHSLGGAMATICAGRCFLSHIDSVPEGLFTYGSPRVGNKRYINYFRDVYHYRWVNNNDIVTRVPPAWFGYRHCGMEMYLDVNGRLRKVEGWRRVTDRLRGFLRGLTRFKIDHFADHSMDRYIEYIRREVVES